MIVKSDETAARLRNLIGAGLVSGDALLVVLLDGRASWQGCDQRSADWLLAHL